MMLAAAGKVRMQCRPEMPPGCPCPERDEVTVETTVNPARLPRSRLCAFDCDDDDLESFFYCYSVLLLLLLSFLLDVPRHHPASTNFLAGMVVDLPTELLYGYVALT